MKDGHYSRPVWADDGWLAKYAGKTLDEDNVGADGGVSAEYVPGATATIGKYNFEQSYEAHRCKDYKTAQISENSATVEAVAIFIGITVYPMKSLKIMTVFLIILSSNYSIYSR